jgi:hypothetical protein
MSISRTKMFTSIFAHTETFESTFFSTSTPCCANLLLNRIRFPYFANKTATPQYSVAKLASTNIALFGPSPSNILCPNKGSTPESTARRNESEALAEAACEVYVSVRYPARTVSNSTTRNPTSASEAIGIQGDRPVVIGGTVRPNHQNAAARTGAATRKPKILSSSCAVMFLRRRSFETRIS